MTSIQDLRERRAAKAKEARKLLDDNTGEKWTRDISAKVDALYAENKPVNGANVAAKWRAYLKANK